MPRLPSSITLRWFVSVGVLLLGVAAAVAATPDRCHSDPACRALTESAMKKVQAFDYENGLKDFQAAYARKPEPRLLVNIGRCYFRMSRPDEAMNYYRRFQETPGFVPDAELAQALKQYIAEAEAVLAKPKARLVLSVAAPGDILIDGQLVAQGPVVRSFELLPGSHRLQYTGEVGAPRELNLEAGKELALSLGAVPSPPPVAEPSQVATSDRLPRPRWRLVGGGVALGLGGVLIGLSAGALAVNGRCSMTTDSGLCDGRFDENGIRMTQLYDSLGAGVGMLVPGLALAATGAVLIALPGPRRQKVQLRAAR